MKTLTKKTNYRQNHLINETHAKNQVSKENNINLKLKHFDNEGVYAKDARKDNTLVVFMEGEFTVHCSYFEDKNFSAGQMISIPAMHPYTIKHSADAKLFIFHFDSPSSSCAKKTLYSVKHLVTEATFRPASLEVNEPLGKFIDLLRTYIQTGADCNQLHELKVEEFFFIIKWYYKRDDIAHFFYPILKHACSFRRFILENYQKMNSVSEMVEASNMSKTVFYEKFKKEFGISAKQWIIERLKQRIILKAQEPESTAKSLMLEFDFSSPEHLNAFCKKQFGLTPTKLIEQLKSGEQGYVSCCG